MQDQISPQPTLSDVERQIAESERSAGLESFWLWLGRYGRQASLLAEVARLRHAVALTPDRCLALAYGLRLSGDAVAADALVLEADRLDPSLGLAALPGASRPEPPPGSEAHRLLSRLSQWRWLSSEALLEMERAWLLQARDDWTQGFRDDQLDWLALLLHHPQRRPELLLAGLTTLVDQAAMQANPAAALRVWGLLADALPDWDYARLKAVEMALTLQDLRRCAAWLSVDSPSFAANPWASDLAARHALAEARLLPALEHWGRALALAGEAGETNLVEIFRQRRREARRGRGVLTVRSLLESGDTEAALPLLEVLLAQDPQWQPLRALREQLQVQAPGSGDAGAARFARVIERAATRLAVVLAPSQETWQEGSHASRLDHFSAVLLQAEARLALAG